MTIKTEVKATVSLLDIPMEHAEYLKDMLQNYMPSETAPGHPVTPELDEHSRIRTELFEALKQVCR